MALVYATSAELAAAPWSVSPLPANVPRLLAYASQLVRKATSTAVYATDATGAPTDAAVVAGFRDAVCAQVSAWAAADINPAQAGGGQSTIIAGKGLSPRNIQYAVYEADAAQRRYITMHLTDEAAGYLADLNLPSSPWVTG